MFAYFVKIMLLLFRHPDHRPILRFVFNRQLSYQRTAHAKLNASQQLRFFLRLMYAVMDNDVAKNNTFFLLNSSILQAKWRPKTAEMKCWYTTAHQHGP